MLSVWRKLVKHLKGRETDKSRKAGNLATPTRLEVLRMTRAHPIKTPVHKKMSQVKTKQVNNKNTRKSIARRSMTQVQRNVNGRKEAPITWSALSAKQQ